MDSVKTLENSAAVKLNFLSSVLHFLAEHKIAIRIFILVSLLIWCIGFAFNSLFGGSPEAALAYPFLKKIYHMVCHQLDEKTFTVKGEKLFVCARCTGIYLGALASSLASLFFFKNISLKLKLLYASMIPMAVDVFATTFGIYHYSKTIAFLTGIFFGSVVFIYILAAIENNFVDKSF